MSYYPMMVQLRQKRCVVVGGGQIAERKIGGLLTAGADDVTVVSPTSTDMILAWEQSGKMTVHHRPFEPADVEDAVIVIAATNDSVVNLAVHEACLPHQWINIVDRPDLCTFTVPSVVERGDLQIAISTGGHNPGLAKKLRRQLEQWIGPEYEAYTQFLGEMRRQVRALDRNEREKRAILSALLDDRFLYLTQTGEIERRDHEAAMLLDKREENELEK